MWSEFFKPKGDGTYIDFAFLATRGGLVRYYDNSQPGQGKTIQYLSKYGDDDTVTDLYAPNRYPLFYRRATTYPPGTYVYSQSRSEISSFLQVMSPKMHNTNFS